MAAGITRWFTGRHCGNKENRGGKYYTLVYGKAAALNIDPIEKKPLFHFLPGSRAFSIGTAGCNFDCKNCQNWEISQVRPEQIDHPITLPPETIVSKAPECPAARAEVGDDLQRLHEP